MRGPGKKRFQPTLEQSMEPKPGLGRSGKFSYSEKPELPKQGCALPTPERVPLILLETEILLSYLKK